MSTQGFENENMSISYEGFDTTIDALTLVPERVKNRILRMLQTSADRILSQSQAQVPVDTGALKESGHVTPVVEGNGEDIAFEVTYGDGSSTPTTYTYGDMEADGYSWFQEMGTVHIVPQKYLSGPFTDETASLEDRIAKILDEIGGLG